MATMLFELPDHVRQELECEKNEFLTGKQNLIVSTVFDTIPRHRVSWEVLQNHIQTNRGNVIKRMLSAKKGSGAGLEFAKRSQSITCPVTLYCEQMDMLLHELLPEYAGQGFDLDLFVLLYEPGLLSVRSEVFPRHELDKMEQTIASPLRFDCPYLLKPGFESEDREDFIKTFILWERLQKGESQEEICRDFFSKDGLWPISSPDTIAYFLNRVFLSIVSANDSQENGLIGAGSIISSAGEVKEAFLRSY